MNRRAPACHSRPTSGFYTTNSSYFSRSRLFLVSHPKATSALYSYWHRDSDLGFEWTEGLYFDSPDAPGKMLETSRIAMRCIVTFTRVPLPSQGSQTRNLFFANLFSDGYEFPCLPF